MLHNYNSPPSAIKVVKLRRTKWIENMGLGEMENAGRFLSEIMKGIGQLEDLDVDRRAP